MTPGAWTEAFTSAVRAALGSDAVDSPRGLLRPSDREGMRRAAGLLHEHRIPWRPVGRPGDLGEGVHLSAEHLNSVIDLWREDLVARIGAGCSLQAAQRGLARHGLRVPATAVHPDHDTLGLLFATGQRGWRSGPNRALRESVLGLTAIDGAARVLKGGGRVAKNVAGYDLVRLHHGAAGAFGILSDLVVKLEALPEAAAELTVAGRAEQVPEVLGALRAPAQALDPVAQIWCDPGASALLGLAPEGALLLQVEGWAESVDPWRDSISKPAAAVSIQDLLARLEAAAAWQGVWQMGSRTVLTQGAECLERWRQRGFGIWMSADLLAGGATLYAEDPRGPLGEALADLLRLGGRVYCAPGRPCPEGMRTVQPAEVVSRLKDAFDPAGLLPLPPLPLERVS